MRAANPVARARYVIPDRVVREVIRNPAALKACYDDLAGRGQAGAAPARQQAAPASDTRAPPVMAASGTELERQWQLRPELKQGVFALQAYRPVYALVRATNNPDERAQSPTRPFVGPDSIDLQNAEVKLQLSLQPPADDDRARGVVLRLSAALSCAPLPVAHEKR